MTQSNGSDGRSASDGASVPVDERAVSRRVLVTGAAGFIGSHLNERLADAGWETWGLDNFENFYDPEIKRRNLRQALSRPQFHFVQGDVRDGVLLRGLLSDVSFDAVVHLAARPGVRPSLDEPTACFESNVMGTINLLEAMRCHGMDRLVFASSSSVYGNRQEAAPFREEDAADRPASPYAASKRSGELLCHTYHHLHDLSTYCLRLFTVYGPRQRPDLAIHKFSRLLARGEPLPLYGDGTSARDYTFVDDAVDGIVHALERLLELRNPRFAILNLGSGEPVQLLELVQALGEAFDVEPDVEHLQDQPGDVHLTHASTDRIREELGFEPSTSLEAGLRAFAEWFRSDSRHEVAAVRAGTPQRDAS